MGVCRGRGKGWCGCVVFRTAGKVGVGARGRARFVYVCCVQSSRRGCVCLPGPRQGLSACAVFNTASRECGCVPGARQGLSACAVFRAEGERCGCVPGAGQGLGLLGRRAKGTSKICVASEPKLCAIVGSVPAGARWKDVTEEGGWHICLSYLAS